MAFPSPAVDYAESRLSLDELCITRPSATFFMRAAAAAPRYGIMSDALLVVDRSRTPVHGSVVVAELDGEFTICVLRTRPEHALVNLESRRVIPRVGNDEFGDSPVIFGVVTYAVNGTTDMDDRVPI